MPIFQQNTLNTTALVVPDLYVQIVPPQNLILNGVPTNVIGIVGTSTWGPVDQPVIIGTMADYAQSFGPISVRKYDMGTAIAAAIQQGAQNFRCVRVTDGSDTAAHFAAAFSGGVYAAMFTAIYTGSTGNNISISLTPSSQTNKWRLTIALPGQLAEVYDNLPVTSAPAFWQGLVDAVTLGNGPLRGPSQLVTAVLGSATATLPASFSNQQLLGGTDGAADVNSLMLVGEDSLPRTGMYALRSQGCSLAMLADADDATQWTTQAAFGLSEGVYMILVSPAGDTIPNAVTVKQQAGLDSYSAKLMFGDWVFWNDQANGVLRLISPQGFAVGRLANLSPEQSGLNKPIYSVVGTQISGVPNSGQNTTYSDAELQTLFENGIDVITAPQPGGSYWGIRCGHNTSSNPTTNGDNYARMTNYIAATLAAAMGNFVGEVINTSLFQRIRSTQLSYLQSLLTQGILGTLNGTPPFSVICDTSNNPLSRTSLGYVQSDAQVQYQGINEKFIVNVEGGQTVSVQNQLLP